MGAQPPYVVTGGAHERVQGMPICTPVGFGGGTALSGERQPSPLVHGVDPDPRNSRKPWNRARSVGRTCRREGSERGVTTRADLRADCARCFALCCVGPAFTRSSEFAIDKPAGVPCPHLATDHRCTIHDRLRPEGFAGCTAYDCFGAGQRLAQETFEGRDWRRHHEVATPMLAALPVVRALHELLWYLLEAAE